MKKEAPQGPVFLLIVILILAAVLAFLPSLSLTKWFIDDKDASSFSGVVLLMALLQFIFFFTGSAKPARDWRGWAAAAAFFILAASVFIFLPPELSLGFWYLRMDYLALSLFLAGALSLLFGAGALWGMRFLPIYLLLAWPLITLLLTGLEPQLTNLTADFVQLLASLLGMAVARGPGNVFTTPASDIPIIIAPACAALAAILGFASFILPFAYHLRGGLKARLAWLFSGALLIILLNLARIATVIILWNSSGINEALSFFYSASGTVLFNVAVIIMLLLISKFGLSLPPLRGTSIFREGPWKPLAREFSGLSAALPSLILPLFALALLTIAFYSLDSGAMDTYSWLAKYGGQAFTAAQANPVTLPYPDDWEFLASDTGFSSDLVVTRFIFQAPGGTQLQAMVMSSANRSGLDFDAAAKLRSEGFAIEREWREPIGKGIIGNGVSYSKEGTRFSTFYWTQPASLGGKPTYAAFLFTIGDDAGYSRAAGLAQIARGFRARLPD